MEVTKKNKVHKTRKKIEAVSEQKKELKARRELYSVILKSC